MKNKYYNRKTRKWSLDKIPSGSYFEAIIDESKCNGLIYNDKKQKGIFLCQNSEEGQESKVKYGFRYSWVIWYDEKPNQRLVKNFKILPKPKGFKAPKDKFKIGDWEVIFNLGSIKVGCTTIPNKLVRKIAKNLKD